MDIGHGVRGFHDARQSGHVHHLLQCLVLGHLREEGFGRKDDPWHAHRTCRLDSPPVVTLGRKMDR